MNYLGLNACCPNPPNRHYVGLSVDSAKMLDLDRLGMNFNVTHKGQVRVALLYMDVGVEVAQQQLPTAHADPAALPPSSIINCDALCTPLSSGTELQAAPALFQARGRPQGHQGGYC